MVDFKNIPLFILLSVKIHNSKKGLETTKDIPEG